MDLWCRFTLFPRGKSWLDTSSNASGVSAESSWPQRALADTWTRPQKRFASGEQKCWEVGDLLGLQVLLFTLSSPATMQSSYHSGIGAQTEGRGGYTWTTCAVRPWTSRIEAWFITSTPSSVSLLRGIRHNRLQLYTPIRRSYASGGGFLWVQELSRQRLGFWLSLKRFTAGDKFWPWNLPRVLISGSDLKKKECLGKHGFIIMFNFMFSFV